MAFDYKAVRTGWLSFMDLRGLTDRWLSPDRGQVLSPIKLATSVIFLFFLAMHFADMQLFQFRVEGDIRVDLNDIEAHKIDDGVVEIGCKVSTDCKTGRLRAVLLGKTLTQAPDEQVHSIALTDRAKDVDEADLSDLQNLVETVVDSAKEPRNIESAVNALALPLLLVSAFLLALTLLAFGGGSMRNAARAYAFSIYLHSCFLQAVFLLLLLRITVGSTSGGIRELIATVGLFGLFALVSVWRALEGTSMRRAARFLGIFVSYNLLLLLCLVAVGNAGTLPI